MPFKKGDKNINRNGAPKTTITRKAALKRFKLRVRKSVDRLFNAQFDLALGCQFLFVTKDVGKGKNKKRVTERVTSPAIIEAYLSDELDDDNYYYISTEKPDGHAINSLLDRTFGKAKQNVGLGGGDDDSPFARMLRHIYGKKEPLTKKRKPNKNPGTGTNRKDAKPGVAPKQSVLDQKQGRKANKV